MSLRLSSHACCTCTSCPLFLFVVLFFPVLFGLLQNHTTMTVADALKKWDFYKKIPQDLTESTIPGISLSMCGTVVMVSEPERRISRHLIN